MTHDPIEDLLGVYALDALDDEERAAVEAHLETCPRCRAEVDAHREVAAQLALGGAPAPSGLWERIAGAIDGEGTPPPMRLVVDDGGSRNAEVLPLRRRPRFGLAALAAAAAVAIFALSVSSISQREKVERLEEARSIEDDALDAFLSTDARQAELVGTDGTVLRAVVLPDGTGFLVADSLPDLDGSIYQLWGAIDDHVVSLGSLGEAPTTEAFGADPAITELMITQEDEPVEAPTRPPLAQGPLV